jgi:hypothetical protein
VLAVVDHEQRLPRSEVSGDLFNRVFAGTNGQSESGDERPREGHLVCDGGKVDKPDALDMRGDLPVSDLDREPCLAAATYAGECDQPVGAHQSTDLVDSLLPPHQRRPRRGQRHDAGPHAPERRELLVAELTQVDRGLDVTESVGAEIGNPDPGRVSHAVGENALAPVGRGHNPGCLVDGRAVIVVLAFLGLAHVEADPDRERRPDAPIHLGECLLDGLGTLDCRTGSGEGGGERVPGREEHVTLVLGNGVVEDLVVDSQ